MPDKCRSPRVQKVSSNAVLKLSRRPYQLLESANSAIICWKLDGTITFFNRYAQEFFGYTEAEMIGNNVSILCPSHKFDPAELISSVVSKPEKYVSHQNENITKDGRIVWMAWTNKPIYDDDQNMTGIIAVGNDITERRHFEQHLRQSQATYRALARNFNGAVFVLDRDMRYQIADGLALPKIGFTRETLEGKTVAQLDSFTRKLIEPRCRRALAGETFACEDIYNGRTVTTHYTPIWGEDNQVVQIAVTMHDVTDQKKIQLELRRSRDELEERVRQRTSELLSTVEDMQEEIKLRELVERKLTRTNKELDRRARQLARLASELSQAEERERQRLAQILHDHLQQLLLAAKLSLGMLSRQLENRDHARRVSDVISLIEQCIEESRSLTVELSPPVLYEAGLVPAMKWLARWQKEKHDLEVELSMPEKVEASFETAVLIFQCVRELLLNTVKHAKTETACVSICQNDSLIETTVSDNGRGFDINKMWAAAAQSDTGGFGLFSIRERLRILGGDCIIDSAPGRGSSFTLSVPILPAAKPAAAGSKPVVEIPATKPAACTLDRKIRVLIADDHTVLRNGLASMLNYEKDFEVVGQAANGKQAIELARQLAPEIILMDVGMPIMNGIDATRTIANEMPDINILALSMFDDDERVAEMLNAGAFAYATKSESPETLINAIRNHRVSAHNTRISEVRPKTTAKTPGRYQRADG